MLQGYLKYVAGLDAKSQPSFPAPVTQFVASTTRLCALFLCRERLPMVCRMVLGIDALVLLKSRELQVRRAHRRQVGIIHSAAVCRLLDSRVEPGQQLRISACTASTQAARDHRTRPRLVPINILFQSSENARKRSNPPDAPAHPACTAGCAATGELTVFTARRRYASEKCAPICTCPRGAYAFVLFFYIVRTTQTLSCTGCVSRS